MVIKRRLLGVMFPDKKKMNKIIFNTGTNMIILTLKSSSTDTRHKKESLVRLESDMSLRQSVCSHLQPYNVTFFFRVSNYNIKYTHTHMQTCNSFLHTSTYLTLSSVLLTAYISSLPFFLCTCILCFIRFRNTACFDFFFFFYKLEVCGKPVLSDDD